MKSLKEQIEVMEYFLNGGEVEYRTSDRDWKTASTPLWDWLNYDYRKKEKPKDKIIIEKWLCEYEGCDVLKGSKRFFVLEKVVPFEFAGIKVKLLDTYEVEV